MLVLFARTSHSALVLRLPSFEKEAATALGRR